MVAIVTDSTADLPPERAEQLGIHIVPLSVTIDGATYADGAELAPAEFYQKLRATRGTPSTSQPSAGRFQEVYESIDADEIVSIHISQGLSGTLNSARAAAEQVKGKHIRIVDSRQVSLSMGYLAQQAAESARRGASLEDICQQAEASAANAGFYAALDTLHFAQRSGRIGFARALLGSMLQVKPLITLREGQVQPLDKPRTMRRAIERLAELTEQAAPLAYLAVPHAANEPLAQELAERLAPVSPGNIDVVTTGAVVGTHCGPGAVASCYIRK
ncbi:MAG TPA: DegV family protein [Chloroflexota bacterium]